MSLIGGLITLLVVINPVLGIEPNDFADDVSAFLDFPSIAETRESELERRIREDCESYILDKAASLGMDICVEVSLNTEAALPYPASAVIEGFAQASDRLALSKMLEEDLGIPLDKQEWNTD